MDFFLSPQFFVGVVVGLVVCHLYMKKGGMGMGGGSQ